MEEYEAEAEFVHYLAENGASVADVIPSRSGKLVERMQVKPSVIGLSEAADGAEGDAECFVSLFAYAKGILLSENGYHYRDGAPLSELFYNMGKTIGAIHRLSKQYPRSCWKSFRSLSTWC